MYPSIFAPGLLAGLLGPGWDGTRPAEGTRAELDLARELSAALARSSGRSSRNSGRGPWIRRRIRAASAAS